MWTTLHKYNQNNNRVWISARRKAFSNEKFDHQSESIQIFYTRFLNHKAELASTTRPISTDDVLEKLLDSVPEDFNWSQARLHCLNMTLGIADTMTVLNNVVNPGSIGSAHLAGSKGNGRKSRGIRENRGNRGGQRGIGRPGGQGKQYNL